MSAKKLGWRRRAARFFWQKVTTEWQGANADLRSTDRSYDRHIAQAKDDEEKENLIREWRAVREPEQAEVDRLLSSYWRKKAARHRIPEPERNAKYWDHNPFKGTHLTVAGIDFIENRIYEKRKRRWDFWLALGPLVIGVIGALIGLATILLHHSK